MADYRRQAFGCSLALLVIMGAMFAFSYWRASSRSADTTDGSIEDPGDAPLPAPTPKPVTPSVAAQIDSFLYKQQFSEALQLCRHFIQEGPDDARKTAVEKLPSLLTSEFRQRLQAGSHAQAHAILNEMSDFGAQAAAQGPESKSHWQSALNDMRREWNQSQENRLREALKAGDDAAIESLVADIAADPEGRLPAHEYLEFRMKRWTDELRAGRADAADIELRKAAAVAAGETPRAESWGFERSIVEETLRNEIPREQLLETGKRLLADKDYARACCYLLAYREPENEHVPNQRDEMQKWQLEHLQRRLLGFEALNGLAREALAGKLRWLPPDVHENRIEVVLSIVIGSTRDIDRIDQRVANPREKYALAIDAWKTQFELWQGKLERLIAAGEFEPAESLVSDVLRDRSASYKLQFCVQYLKEDPWAAVPGELRAAIEKKFKDPQQRLAELMMAVRREEYTPEFPGRQRLIDRLTTALAGNGIAQLSAQPSEAYRAFRNVLRRAPNSAAAANVRAALTQALHDAREAKDAKKLYNHAVFFMGELGSGGAGPEIREELASGLQTLVDIYKNQPMQHIFMLTLLADALAGDPRGKAAADQALTLGFEAVAKFPAEAKAQQSLLPSLIKGCTVVALDNATEHHLLTFFDGPERFYVRIGPYRRGTVVLKDGAYTTGAVITREDVNPSRAQVTYRSEFSMRRYAITTSTAGGKKEQEDKWAQASGDYTLLRVPPDAGRIKVEPKSGMALPGE